MSWRAFDHPRLAALYDVENLWARDDDFFLALANETAGSRVLDLGCGTGRLTVALAAAGHAVTGVDPAWASLAAAREKPGGEHVTWIEGSAADAPRAAFDLALMTSHVAQVFVEDEHWRATLDGLSSALVPGGRLAFDSRDPAARAWERWNASDELRLPDATAVSVRTELDAVEDGTVSFTATSVFEDGEELAIGSTLRFRTEQELRSSLEEHGFEVEAVYGGWAREPVGAGDGELVVVARLRPPA